MHRNSINCEVLTGTVLNKRILIPCINLTYSGTILPFNLQRTHITYNTSTCDENKSQGQPFLKIGIYLNRADLYMGNCISQQVEFVHYTI